MPELLTEYETAPGPLPPVVNKRRFVRKTADVEVRVKVACTVLVTVIETEFVESIRTLTREKMKNDIVIIINPTIENIMNNELYKLEYNNENYYVPLWHDEISYDISETEYLIVKCKPELPENIFIDHNNDVHIKIVIESIGFRFKPFKL